MGFHSAVEEKIEGLAGETLTWSLILIGILLILVALFVANKWLKAAILAWVVLP